MIRPRPSLFSTPSPIRVHPRKSAADFFTVDCRFSASSILPYLLPKRLSDEDSRPEQAQRSEGSPPFIFNRMRTLQFSVSPNPFVSHSYENCRGCTQFF